MAVGPLKHNSKRKIFHATLHVTRIEEWSIEAESVEEARQLLNDGQGERSHVGHCIHCEVASIEEERARTNHNSIGLQWRRLEARIPIYLMLCVDALGSRLRRRTFRRRGTCAQPIRCWSPFVVRIAGRSTATREKATSKLRRASSECWRGFAPDGDTPGRSGARSVEPDCDR
jgi:hypothetical protein